MRVQCSKKVFLERPNIGASYFNRVSKAISLRSDSVGSLPVSFSLKSDVSVVKLKMRLFIVFLLASHAAQPDRTLSQIFDGTGPQLKPKTFATVFRKDDIKSHETKIFAIGDRGDTAYLFSGDLAYKKTVWIGMIKGDSILQAWFHPSSFARERRKSMSSNLALLIVKFGIFPI